MAGQTLTRALEYTGKVLRFIMIVVLQMLKIVLQGVKMVFVLACTIIKMVLLILGAGMRR